MTYCIGFSGCAAAACRARCCVCICCSLTYHHVHLRPHFLLHLSRRRRLPQPCCHALRFRSCFAFAFAPWCAFPGTAVTRRLVAATDSAFLRRPVLSSSAVLKLRPRSLFVCPNLCPVQGSKQQWPWPCSLFTPGVCGGPIMNNTQFQLNSLGGRVFKSLSLGCLAFGMFVYTRACASTRDERRKAASWTRVNSRGQIAVRPSRRAARPCAAGTKGASRTSRSFCGPITITSRAPSNNSKLTAMGFKRMRNGEQRDSEAVENEVVEVETGGVTKQYRTKRRRSRGGRRGVTSC
jgi:hypothetical protein